MRCTQIYVPLEIRLLNCFRQTRRLKDGGVGGRGLTAYRVSPVMVWCLHATFTDHHASNFLMTFSVFFGQKSKWKCAQNVAPGDPLHYECRLGASPGRSWILRIYFTYLLLDHLLSHWRPVRSSLGSAVQRYLVQLLLQLCHLRLQYQLLLSLLLHWLSCCRLRRPRLVYWATSLACWQL